MKLEFTKEGLLPEEILERIRGRPTKYGWQYPNSRGFRQNDEQKPRDSPGPAAESSAEYYFMIDGLVPELMRGVAFRRAKHYNTREMKAVKCPHCQNDFEYVEKKVKLQVFRHSPKTKALRHNSLTCHICHHVVDVIYESDARDAS